MDSQQEIFTELKTRLEKLGYSVYDSVLPPDGTPYPFIYLGENQQIDTENKSAVFGSVFQTIHVWHDSPKKRGTVSNMLSTVKMICRTVEHTPNFSWFVKNTNQMILTDTTTKTPLLHGVLKVEFRFS